MRLFKLVRLVNNNMVPNLATKTIAIVKAINENDMHALY